MCLPTPRCARCPPPLPPHLLSCDRPSPLRRAQALALASLMPRRPLRPRSWLASGDKRTAATLERRAARAAFATWGQRGLGANVLQCASDETCVLPAAVQLVLDEQQEALRRAKSLPASSLSGYCAQTPCIKHDYHTSTRSCSRAKFGCWLAREHGIKDLADCVERCRSCRNCNYVSFSRSSAHNDCSWFRKCNMSALVPPPETGLDYATMQVL